MKIAINTRFGGFSLSREVFDELGLTWNGYGFIFPKDFEDLNQTDFQALRAHPRLIAAIEAVQARGFNPASEPSEIKIVEIPDDVDWYIHEYEGKESIYERARVWG